MKTSYLLLACSLALAITSFINGHSEIKSLTDLLQVQTIMSLLGIAASVVMTWVGKSPLHEQMKPENQKPD